MPQARRRWEKLREIVLDHPKLFDNKFRAGVLRVPPQKIHFKDADTMKTPRCTRIKPLTKKECQVMRAWVSDALEKGILRYPPRVGDPVYFPSPSRVLPRMEKQSRSGV